MEAERRQVTVLFTEVVGLIAFRSWSAEHDIAIIACPFSAVGARAVHRCREALC